MKSYSIDSGSTSFHPFSFITLTERHRDIVQLNLMFSRLVLAEFFERSIILCAKICSPLLLPPLCRLLKTKTSKGSSFTHDLAVTTQRDVKRWVASVALQIYLFMPTSTSTFFYSKIKLVVLVNLVFSVYLLLNLPSLGWQEKQEIVMK